MLKGGPNGEARFKGQQRDAEWRRSKDRSILVWPKLIEDKKGDRKVILRWSRALSDPFVVPSEVGWQSCSKSDEAGASVRIGRCPGLMESSDPPRGSSSAGWWCSCHSLTAPAGPDHLFVTHVP